MAEADERDLSPEEREIQEQRSIEALDRAGEVEQLTQLLKQEPARDLLWRVLVHCHVFSAVYQKNFGDMAHAEGERNVGLWLLSEIGEADPEALLAMQLKANRLKQQQHQQELRRRSRRRS